MPFTNSVKPLQSENLYVSFFKDFAKTFDVMKQINNCPSLFDIIIFLLLSGQQQKKKLHAFNNNKLINQQHSLLKWWMHYEPKFYFMAFLFFGGRVQTHIT